MQSVVKYTGVTAGETFPKAYEKPVLEVIRPTSGSVKADDESSDWI